MAAVLQVLFKNMRGIVALIVVGGGIVFLFSLMFKPVPYQNSDILNVASGMIITAMAGVIQYYFGSSKDKSDSEKAAITNAQSNQNEN